MPLQGNAAEVRLKEVKFRPDSRDATKTRLQLVCSFFATRRGNESLYNTVTFETDRRYLMDKIQALNLPQGKLDQNTEICLSIPYERLYFTVYQPPNGQPIPWGNADIAGTVLIVQPSPKKQQDGGYSHGQQGQQNYGQPGQQNYGPPAAPPQSWGPPAAPPAQNYGPPAAPPQGGWGGPAAPPAQNYGPPAGPPQNWGPPAAPPAFPNASPPGYAAPPQGGNPEYAPNPSAPPQGNYPGSQPMPAPGAPPTAPASYGW